MRVSGDEEIQHEDEHYERYYLKWLSSLKRKRTKIFSCFFRTKAKKINCSLSLSTLLNVQDVERFRGCFDFFYLNFFDSNSLYLRLLDLS